MKYVDNLLEVKPEEIALVNGVTPIQTIIKVKTPCFPTCAVVVVYENGACGAFTTDGREYIGDRQRFYFKPKKTKKLKPLHKILAEFPDYYIAENGSIYICGLGGKCITTGMLQYLGTNKWTDWCTWDERLFEEVEE